MEWLAYAMVGAMIGEWLLGARLQNRAMGWGALIALLLLVYVVLWPLADTATRLLWVRGPTVSLLAVVLMALALARPLSKRWKREKITPARAGWFVFAVGCGHLMLACMDAVGAAVLWPFFRERVAFGHLHWSDPLIVLPALVCLVWLAFVRTGTIKQRAKRRRLLVWGTGLFVGYVMFTVAMKFTAAAGFDADLERRGAGDARRAVTPERFTPLAWRAVVDGGDVLWVGRRSVFQWPSTPVRWIVYPRGVVDAGAFADEREVRRVQAIAGGYWIASRHNRGLWIADVRAGALREFETRDQMVDHRMMRAWNFEPEAPKDRLVPAHARQPGVGESLRETAMRVIGRDEGADLVPRLAGVPGKFPEILDVVE